MKIVIKKNITQHIYKTDDKYEIWIYSYTRTKKIQPCVFFIDRPTTCKLINWVDKSSCGLR